jgi:hypothetical protein
MQPFTVILGIVLGSLFSIGFSLAAVLLVFWILQNDDPRFADEMPELARSTLIFSALAVLAAISFLGTLKQRFWRYPFLALLVVGFLGTARYYWPE